MVDISDVQFTHSALSAPSFQMVYFVLQKTTIKRMKTILPSTIFTLQLDDVSNLIPRRERRCFAVFNSLIDMVPDLKRRISDTDGSNGVLEIANLVGLNTMSIILPGLILFRCRKESHVQDPTIPEAWKELFLIGLFLVARYWHLRYTATWNTTEVSIMIELAFYCVPQTMTGQMKSWFSFYSAWILLINTCCHRIKQQLRSGEIAFSGDVWPNFVFKGYKCDPSDVWSGLFRSDFLVTVN